ncbi:MAG: 4Fe-4S cluster-binding domain-containing protein, partial [Lachnospiraceae bacterium]
IKTECPDKKIWCYTGYTWEQIFPIVNPYLNLTQAEMTRQNAVKNCDILVDGRFVEEEKDLSLEFRGSKNQRIIDVKERITSK